MDAVGNGVVLHAEVHSLPDVPELYEVIAMDGVRLHLDALAVDVDGLAADGGLEVVRRLRGGAAEG